MPVPRHPSAISQKRKERGGPKGKEKHDPPSQPSRQETIHPPPPAPPSPPPLLLVANSATGCYHPPNVLQPIRRFCSSPMTFLLSSNRYTPTSFVSPAAAALLHRQFRDHYRPFRVTCAFLMLPHRVLEDPTLSWWHAQFPNLHDVICNVNAK